MLYRKKPVVIEAYQYTGDNGLTLKNWSKGAVIESPVREPSEDDPCGAYVQIKTLEGVMIGITGDYIIKGVNGEFYPCKPDIFDKTYETAEEVSCDGIKRLSFSQAFEFIKQDDDHYMRLHGWKPDVKIKVWSPWPVEKDNKREMTARFLYAESRFGRVPWKETMIELFSDEWEIGSD